MQIRECTTADLGEIFSVINDAAIAYRGVIPSDRWHEPYMPMGELRDEISAGVAFSGMFGPSRLEAVMGLQPVKDVALVRHAYTRTASQGRGLGKALLRHVLAKTDLPVLIGTWRSATWAIGFYRSQGFALADDATKKRLLREFWSIPERQAEESVVLVDARWRAQRSAEAGIELVPMGKSAEDFEFALEAKRQALGPHIAERWGWDEAAQRRQQWESWQALGFSTIVRHGGRVGAVSLESASDHVKIIGMYVLPAHQRQGIGGEVLRRIIGDGHARNLPVRLRCLKWNPASSLYRRHGFIITGETETHFLMERPVS